MRLILAFVALLALTFGAQAQFLRNVNHFPAKFAVGGKPMMVWEGSSLTPTCVSRGSVSINVLRAPAHGTLSVKTTGIFPNFPPNAPAGHCNTRTVRGQRVTYVAQRGYAGPDDVDFEAIYPDGMVRHLHVPIVVR